MDTTTKTAVDARAAHNAVERLRVVDPEAAAALLAVLEEPRVLAAIRSFAAEQGIAGGLDAAREAALS